MKLFALIFTVLLGLLAFGTVGNAVDLEGVKKFVGQIRNMKCQDGYVAYPKENNCKLGSANCKPVTIECTPVGSIPDAR